MGTHDETRCRFDAERLSAYHDDALAEAERRTVAEHLRDCRECRGRLEEFRRIDAEVADLPVSGWNDGAAQRFTAGVMARIATPAASTATAVSLSAPARPSGPRSIRRRVPLGWLGATLATAAALLVMVAGTRTERTTPAPQPVERQDPPALAFKSNDSTPRTWVGKDGSIHRFDANLGDMQTAGITQKQVLFIQQEENLGLSGTNSVTGAWASNDRWVAGYGCEAQATLNYRGLDHANPAVAVDEKALAQRSLADSEALMTLLVNSSEMDADGFAQLREAIVANGVDDRLRAAVQLAADPDVARPLGKMQVLLVRLANGAAEPAPEELSDWKKAIVGQGLIEHVRQSRERLPAAEPVIRTK